jgi:hypothetical protein
MRTELKELIAMVKLLPLPEEEKEAQRRSFAYGNTKIENDRVTWEMVDQEAERMA